MVVYSGDRCGGGSGGACITVAAVVPAGNDQRASVKRAFSPGFGSCVTLQAYDTAIFVGHCFFFLCVSWL